MDLKYCEAPNTLILNKMVLVDLKSSSKSYDPPNDLQMTSSLLSVTSSLTSPVDSGVQLLDSESDIASVMSMSGTACDLDAHLSNDTKEELETETICTDDKDLMKEKNITVGENNPDFLKMCLDKEPFLVVGQQNVMTKSDIANQNVAVPYDCGIYSSSAPTSDFDSKNMKNSEQYMHSEEEKQDADKAVSVKDPGDVPAGSEMHVSVSEEMKEAPGVQTENAVVTPAEEQIVFRRQRKKKSSKSDTPKKRVSFHEDILNSTRTDDIHIDHGFITQQPDISMSFFNWDSVRKRDVVKGRYSWAAEGDTPYYQRSAPERETRSELYQSQSQAWSGSSCTSSSVDSSSSNSLCDNDSSSDGKPGKHPRSSCLKKRSNTKRIETRVLEESLPASRKSESNLLDSNIFGSLKNILSLSTSVPLAERGVPEGQEDVTVSACASTKQQAFAGRSWNSRSVDRSDTLPDLPLRRNSGSEPPRTNLRLVPSEEPAPQPNVLLCDSTVYEHKGISYSYEYDKFQKSFETHQTAHKPKSSTVYQLLLQDLNFFKKRDKEISENNLQGICNGDAPHTSTPNKESCSSFVNKSQQSDWSSETTETISDFCDNVPSKHLSSPKHKVKPNHYSVQNFKENGDAKSEDGNSKNCLKPATSKSSLINRFLRNVTMKKLLDAKLHKKQKLATNRCMGLYMKGAKPDEQLCRDLDRELELEVQAGQGKRKLPIDQQLGSNFMLKLKKEVFRDAGERLCALYKVRSVYSMAGETRPLVVFLTEATLYVAGLRANQAFESVFVLPYSELDTVLIGPDAHTVHFSSCDGEMQCFLATGSSELTGALVSRLETALRALRRGRALPAVRHLAMRDMARLRAHVCRRTAVARGEEYCHYALVSAQEVSGEPAVTPLGPVKEGPLMFRTCAQARWQTGYFILKGGVLYMLSSPSNRLPMRALPLSGGGCVGAHRLAHCARPHTFELLLGSLALQLAAPDEYVASDWLQVLVQTAGGLYAGHGQPQTHGQTQSHDTQFCTLLLTSAHVVTVRETWGRDMDLESQARVLGCAAIADMTALRIPQAEQSWCLLEFSCREVHETSGDLVLFFTTNAELERFLATIEMLWAYNNTKGDSFPLSTISEHEPINKKCVDAFRTLQQAWSAVGVSLD